jgi:hypothetical protein
MLILMGIIVANTVLVDDASQWERRLALSVASTIGLPVPIPAGILLLLILFKGRQTEPQTLWRYLFFLGIFTHSPVEGGPVPRQLPQDDAALRG